MTRHYIGIWVQTPQGIPDDPDSGGGFPCVLPSHSSCSLLCDVVSLFVFKSAPSDIHSIPQTCNSLVVTPLSVTWQIQVTESFPLMSEQLLSHLNYRTGCVLCQSSQHYPQIGTHELYTLSWRVQLALTSPPCNL